ncbi:MAG TPA: hypothetical protein VN668_02050 [Stellaceae bacterium]|nr:hypothetical protein [Stellaceae bacterium]
MVTLVLIVCLSGSPSTCHEETPPIDAINPMACMVQGQQIAAQWLEDHPKWRLDGWRCKFGPRQQPT